MAGFTVRVELHSSNAYAELHELMEKAGFKRKVMVTVKKIIDGKEVAKLEERQLPTAEYRYYDGSEKLTLSAIWEMAFNVAKLVKSDSKKTPHVLVTQGQFWVGGTPADFS